MLAVQVVRSQLVRKVGVVCHQHGLVVAAWTCVDEDTEVVFRGGRTGSCDWWVVPKLSSSVGRDRIVHSCVAYAAPDRSEGLWVQTECILSCKAFVFWIIVILYSKLKSVCFVFPLASLVASCKTLVIVATHSLIRLETDTACAPQIIEKPL